MITLQDLEPVEVLDSINETKYCHVVCCNMPITLCGTYKPKLCGASIINDEGIYVSVCPVCKLEICPDCEEIVFEGCPVCGD